MEKIINSYISRLFLILFCSISMAGISFGQQKDQNKLFVYIQNENGSPFYVKTNDTLLSSTQAGYMILPQLLKGNHKITIGFPKKQLPEASFDIHLGSSEDKGFLIKEANHSFLLYDIRSHQALKPVEVASSAGNRIIANPEAETTPPMQKQQEETAGSGAVGQPVAVSSPQKIQKDTTAPKSNPFEEMLNAVTGNNETATNPAPVQQPQQENAEDSASETLEEMLASANDSPATQPAPPPNTDEPENPVQQTGIASPEPEKEIPSVDNPRTEIKPRPELTFITFPSDSTVVLPPEEKKDSNNQKITLPPEEKKQPEENDLFAGILNEKSSDTLKNQEKKVEEDSDVQQTHMINSDCEHLANEDDFQKVRRKMASRSDGQSMYRAAEKYFSKETCYTTAQIQSLAYLFMTDEYRYKFLEMAYAHVYDSGKFSSLVNTLTSDYYRGRFKAMVR